MSPKGMFYVPDLSGPLSAVDSFFSFSRSDVALLLTGAVIAAPFMIAGGAIVGAVKIPSVVYDATKTGVVAVADEIGGTASLGSQVREGSKSAGYRFGDFSRGVLAKGKGKRSGDTGDRYKFGDFLTGVFTSSADPAVQSANRVALINAGQQLMLQHRLAIAKLTHPRLAANSVVADYDFDVLRKVIALLGFHMLRDAADDTKVEMLMRTNSRLSVYGSLVSDSRFAEPGGLIIGDPIAVMGDDGKIAGAGVLDSYDSTQNLYCMHTATGLMGFQPTRVMSLKGAVGQNFRIGAAAKTWVDPGVRTGMERVLSTLYKPDKPLYDDDGLLMGTSSSAPVSVPVGAIARITKFSEAVYSISREPNFGQPQPRRAHTRTGLLYATVVVGLRADMAEAGELGNHGRLGVLMDGPPGQDQLTAEVAGGTICKARYIECALPLHCLERLVKHEDGEIEVEEGVPLEPEPELELEPEPER